MTDDTEAHEITNEIGKLFIRANNRDDLTEKLQLVKGRWKFVKNNNWNIKKNNWKINKKNRTSTKATGTGTKTTGR